MTQLSQAEPEKEDKLLSLLKILLDSGSNSHFNLFNTDRCAQRNKANLANYRRHFSSSIYMQLSTCVKRKNKTYKLFIAPSFEIKLLSTAK